MDKATLSPGTLADLYRLAWLLTGEAALAEQALAEAVATVPRHLEGLRNPAQRHAWLIARIRQSCRTVTPPAEPAAAPRLLREEALPGLELLEIEAYIVARHFQALPEPDRTALALFYVDLLSPAESAKLLEMSLEAYGGVLARARVALHARLRALQAPAALV